MLKQYLLLFTFMLSLTALSQVKTSYGIVMSANSNSLLKKETNWKQTNLNDSINSIKLHNKTGFTIGFAADFLQHRKFTLRVKTLLSMNKANLNYTNKNSYKPFKINNIIAEIPLEILYFFKQKNAPYIITGFSLSHIFKAKNLTNILPSNFVKLKPFAVSSNIGLGYTFNTPKIKTRIELNKKFTLNNVILTQNNIIDNTISKIRINPLSFSIILMSPK